MINLRVRVKDEACGRAVKRIRAGTAKWLEKPTVDSLNPVDGICNE
jgi:hypothetical protein